MRPTRLEPGTAERLRALDGEVVRFHPALGYWAKTYGLEQAAVESGGSEPGARHLAALSARMEGQLLRVLVVEPQFAPNRARSVAASLGLGVLVFDPLATDLVAELDALAERLGMLAEQQATLNRDMLDIGFHAARIDGLWLDGQDRCAGTVYRVADVDDAGADQRRNDQHREKDQ